MIKILCIYPCFLNYYNIIYLYIGFYDQNMNIKNQNKLNYYIYLIVLIRHFPLGERVGSRKNKLCNLIIKSSIKGRKFRSERTFENSVWKWTITSRLTAE